MIVVAYIRVASWLVTSYRQTFRIRVALLQAVLRQEIGWFDTHDAGELGSRLAESVLIVLCGGVLPNYSEAKASVHCPSNKLGD